MVQALVMAGTETPNHHGSHRDLLCAADDATPHARVDAIVVPTARPVVYLKEAARAALALNCPLVTLHSRKWTSAHIATDYLGQSVDLIAIDMPGPAQLRLPELETSGLLANTLFKRRTDVSDKRNLALMLSHMLGWERVVFLDDDIRVPNPDDLGRAVSLLDIHTAVGLHIGGFPDNSMVCHAYRDAGGWQETFIGGGALAVDVRRNRSFFPNVYNEDWFYILDAEKGLQSVATVGEVLQYPYDPYRPERARTEEFGDVLAEGTFWLLDQGRAVADGDLAHWQDFLSKRRKFIEQVQGMVGRSTTIKPAERAQMGEALTAALGRLACISADFCVAYMQAWVADQARWQDHIQGEKQRPEEREAVLRSLSRKGGRPLTWCTYQRCSVPAPSARRGRPRAVVPKRLRPLLPGDLQPPMLIPSVSVAPGASPLPTFVSVNASHAAHALEAAEVALAGQKGQGEGDDHSDDRPSQQLHA